ncbi:hypothetical protein ACFVRB_35150 [Streptomyces nojiriensis]|uniref:hypothetical protein n=1 Tax=Streptomyces nojiriensis TaxID=66374 RepID=UPI0036D8AE41
MFRLPRFLILLITALFCLGALISGCTKPPPEPGKWLTTFNGTFTRGKRITDTYHPGQLTELDAQKTRLNKLLSETPKNPPQEVTDAIIRGMALANLMDALSVRSTLDDSAVAVTNAAIISQADIAPTIRSQFLTDMNKTAADIIEDVACGEVWSVLTNSQKYRLGIPTESHDHMNGALEAIEGKAHSILAERWYVDSFNKAINWAKYSMGIYEKATEIAGFLEGGYLTPVDARAYYYYARFCLKPPG